jgi:hypothetical protein
MANQLCSPAKKFPTIEFKIELLRHRVRQQDIARHLGCSEVVISQLVNDRVSMTRMQRISNFLLKIFNEMQAGTFTSLTDYEV